MRRHQLSGSLMSKIGWDVDILNARPTTRRGGGIVLQPEMVEVFRRVGVDLRNVDLVVRSAYRTVLEPDGSIQSKHYAPQTHSCADRSGPSGRKGDRALRSPCSSAWMWGFSSAADRARRCPLPSAQSRDRC
jgi:2-polyprenyl-6-methoxyphenol hydroxylase-like FAD-dependent oxidoreductase